jgi:hypothetical protein
MEVADAGAVDERLGIIGEQSRRIGSGRLV